MILLTFANENQTLMKKTLLIIVASFLFGGFFASCTANRGFVSSLTRADIRQVQQFEPLNYVGIIEKGNNITYSDSLTEVAKTLFEKELSRSKTLPVKGHIVIEDTVVNNKVQYEIYMLMNYVENNVRVKEIPIPPVIDSILLRHGTSASDCWPITGASLARAAIMPDRLAKGCSSASLPWGLTTPYLIRIWFTVASSSSTANPTIWLLCQRLCARATRWRKVPTESKWRI